MCASVCGMRLCVYMCIAWPFFLTHAYNHHSAIIRVCVRVCVCVGGGAPRLSFAFTHCSSLRLSLLTLGSFNLSSFLFLRPLARPLARRPGASVCLTVPYTSSDEAKAVANGAMMAEWIRYHMKLGIKVIVYDRYVCVCVCV